MTNSPTLEQGEHYLSVVAAVPPALSERILGWQVEHAAPEPRYPSHITVHIAPVKGGLHLSDTFMREVRSFVPFPIELGDPETFAPQTPVSYLPVQHGDASIHSLRALCIDHLGQSASPFEFVPHLTIAHQCPTDLLQASLEDFADLPEELRSFEVQEIGIYYFDGHSWENVATISIS